MRNLKKHFFLSAFFLAALFLFGEETAVPGLFQFRLENGMEIYVLENDSAPLAYIEIAVRAGAITQDETNAGLFHLYEHMMFKGNEKFKNQKSFMDAMNKMGVSNWNGSTSIDRVNYYFTVPSALLRQGLEFWSSAIRTPLLREDEFSNEKKVVLSEIKGGYSEPSKIMISAVLKTLFPNEPWKTDVSGSPEIIGNASVAQLKSIQSEYYIPKNTALFVGGNVRANEVCALAQEIFGGWKNPPSENGVHSAKQCAGSARKNPEETVKFVFPDARNSGKLSQFVYYLPGPSGECEAQDTYAADIWNYLLENPDSSFVKDAVDNGSFNIVDADYIGGGYSTMRRTGLISFSCAFVNDDELNCVDRAKMILEYWQKTAVGKMLESGNGFDDSDIEKVAKKNGDGRIYSLETAPGFLKTLSSYWASCGGEYFFDYYENLEKVRSGDVKNFVKKYLENKNGVAVLLVNPEYYEAHKDEFAADGWLELNEKNAYWWCE